MSRLFSPYTLRGTTFRNRVFVSPMCQYSARDGEVNDWHLVHLGSRAVGGAGCVIVEATAVVPEGRITAADLGLWSDAQVPGLARIAAFLAAHGAAPGIQLAHAGRKASSQRPWDGGGPLRPDQGPWATVGPSALAYGPGWHQPRALAADEIAGLVDAWVAAARRADAAGFAVVELHFAHGYLVHEFLSPLTNRRDDAYGGSLANRMRFALEVAAAVRAAWPAEKPLFARLSASDWVEGGWDLASSVVLARELATLGVDLVDCSSGGLVPGVRIPVGPGYQVPFAAAIRAEAGVATGAVGLLTEPQEAEDVVARGDADVVLLARAMLRDPYWPLHAARALGVDVSWPVQYLRAR